MLSIGDRVRYSPNFLKMNPDRADWRGVIVEETSVPNYPSVKWDNGRQTSHRVHNLIPDRGVIPTTAVHQTFVALVYQNGIANVFILDTYQRPESPEGRMARRLLQYAWTSCEWFARGMGAMGATVRTYHCDETGDIADRPWTPGNEPSPQLNTGTVRAEVTIH